MPRLALALILLLLPALGSADPVVKAPVVTPLVRAVEWHCFEHHDCSGHPFYAFDYLPAVREDGKIVVVPETDDGWQHTHVPGLRFVEVATGATAGFSPLGFADDPEAKDERIPKWKEQVARANAELGKARFLPLLRGSIQSGGESESGSVVEKFTIDTVRVQMRDAFGMLPTFGEVFVRVPGKPARVIKPAEWPDAKRCSGPRLTFLGARPELSIAVFEQGAGYTRHPCDGVEEPRVYRFVTFP
jgi:hypothetical protein